MDRNEFLCNLATAWTASGHHDPRLPGNRVAMITETVAGDVDHVTCYESDEHYRDTQSIMRNGVSFRVDAA